MDGVTDLRALSGWILPDGSWQPAEEWWHVSALYDLTEQVPNHFTPELHAALKSGDESKIRRAASEAGFVKISRQQIDLVRFTLQQLRTLQRLVELFDHDAEIMVLLEHGNRQKNIRIERLIKFKSVAPLLS